MHNHDKWFHFTNPWAILALSNRKIRAPQSKLERAIDALIRSQEEAGGWRVLEGYEPFTWATGNALMALGVWFKPYRAPGGARRASDSSSFDGGS